MDDTTVSAYTYLNIQNTCNEIKVTSVRIIKKLRFQLLDLNLAND